MKFYLQEILKNKLNKQILSFSSRFQNNYFNTKSQTATTSSFARPHARHPLLPESTVTSLQPSGPHAFMPPPPPVGPMRLNKPEIPPNRMQQSPSIGMGHPTFRSDFNVNLRFVYFRYFYV